MRGGDARSLVPDFDRHGRTGRRGTFVVGRTGRQRVSADGWCPLEKIGGGRVGANHRAVGEKLHPDHRTRAAVRCAVGRRGRQIDNRTRRNRQIGSRRGQGDRWLRVDRRGRSAENLQRGRSECPARVIARPAFIGDFQPPRPGRILTPVAHGHEGPVRKIGARIAVHFGQAAHRAGRRSQRDQQVAARGVIDVHRHGDVFDPDVVLRGHRELARDAGRILVGNGDAEPRLRDGPLELPGQIRPTGGQIDRPRCIDQARAEFVIVVDVCRRNWRLPVRIGRVHLLRRAHEDLLHVAPTEIRVRLEHEGHHAGSRGSGGRCSAELAVIVAGNIAGRSGAVRGGFAQSGTRSAGGRRDDQIGPGFAVVRLTRAAVECPDGDRVDRIGVTVVVGVVVDLETVAPGPHENCAFATPPGFRGALQRRFGQRAGRLKNAPRVAGAPAVAFDLNQLRQVIHRLGLVSVLHKSGDETHTDDRRLRCGTGDADAVVAAGGRIPGTCRPVIIPCPGIRIIRRGVIPIVVVGRIDVAGKVWMRCLHAVVDDADADTAAAAAGTDGRIGPDRLDVEIRSRERAGLIVELQVPLLVDQCVIGHRSFGVLAGQLRFGQENPGPSRQKIHRPQGRQARARPQHRKTRSIFRKLEGGRAAQTRHLRRVGALVETHGHERRNDPAREFVTLGTRFVENGLRGFAGSGGGEDELLEYLGRSRVDRDRPPLALGIGHPDLIKRQFEVPRHPRILHREIRTGLLGASTGCFRLRRGGRDGTGDTGQRTRGD